VTDTTYYAHSSTGSKRAIFTFIATFIGCLFLLDNTVGPVTGTIFIFVGMFTTSVAIAMPFYFYKKKHLKMYSIVSMIELLLTIFLTVMFFLYFFTRPLDFTAATSSSVNNSPYIARCDEPVPEFTLGRPIISSKLQADAVCSCIWKELSPLDKNLSASLARKDSQDVSEMQLTLFKQRLGVITKTCRVEGL